MHEKCPAQFANVFHVDFYYSIQLLFNNEKKELYTVCNHSMLYKCSSMFDGDLTVGHQKVTYWPNLIDF